MDDSQRAHSVSELVEHHYELLYRYAYRLSGSAADAEDLTQQTFLIVQRKLSQLRETERVRGWLCAILRNCYLKTLKQDHATAVGSLDYLTDPATDEALQETIDPEELQAALNELSEEFRSTLVLFYFEEFSYKEIAEQMDVPIGTVMSRLARAKAFLRHRLSQKPVSASRSAARD